MEELNGLIKLGTFHEISLDEYRRLRNKGAPKALPSMCVLNVKHNENGNPVRTKSRIVVLGNMEARSWEKGEVYAPVITQTQVQLLVSMAVSHKRVLKQADCCNAFCHGVLPKDEVVIFKPPSGCPVSKQGTYWKLDKTLYGLRQSPLHWFNRISSSFKAIGLQSCPNAPCIFYGTLIPGEPPVYIGLYVDDFVYFSESDAVEQAFESKLVNHGVSVDFMQTVNWFLGIQFWWSKTTSGGVRAHLSQATFA
jgi:hypothetical protein